MAKCGMCMGRGSYDDPPWGIRVCVLCHGTGHDDPGVELWDRKGNVQHSAVERFGEARAQMKRIEQEHAAKSEFQREVEKLGASAATVAEPTVVRCVRFCPISDIECKKQCGAICRHEATQQQAESQLIYQEQVGNGLWQDVSKELHDAIKDGRVRGAVRTVRVTQQAEPGADERVACDAAYERWTTSPDFRQYNKPGFDAGYRAAQSGQRASASIADVQARYDKTMSAYGFTEYSRGYGDCLSRFKEQLNQSGQRAGVAEDKPWDAAVHDVLAERTRQITHEGATPFQDDGYTEGELAISAACYALASCGKLGHETPDNWPWTKSWWKPSGGRRDLVKAGALILAEIERIDRAANKQSGAGVS